MNNNKYFIYILSILLLIASCSKPTDETASLDISLTKNPVDYENTGQFLKITTGQAWSISMEYPEGGEKDWCNISELEGSGTTDIGLSYSKNSGTLQRTVLLIVSLINSELKDSVELIQLREGQVPGQIPNPDPLWRDLESDTVHPWRELPEVKTSGPIAFISHRMKDIRGNDIRNYSMLYDAENRIALWVAYPLSHVYMGGSGRTDDWQFDPRIPTKYQANLSSGLGSGYDRGHQLPSASRTITKNANRATFYYSNMTPQLSGLNQRIWVSLENKTRDWVSTCDTLYVVTGVKLTEGDSDEISHIKKMAIPKAYYKVLLRYDVDKDEYNALGFWFEHKAKNGPVTAADAKSVREIEMLTGVNFFNNLPQSVQDRIETELKPGDWF